MQKVAFFFFWTQSSSSSPLRAAFETFKKFCCKKKGGEEDLHNTPGDVTNLKCFDNDFLLRTKELFCYFVRFIETQAWRFYPAAIFFIGESRY